MRRLSWAPSGNVMGGAARARSNPGFALALAALLLLVVGCAPTAPMPAATAEAEAQSPAAVPPPTEDLAKLRANSWQWVAIEGAGGRAEISNPAAYRLTFNTDATLGVAADCASAGGSYQGEAGELEIDLAPLEVPNCGSDSRAGELLVALPSAVRYTFDGERMRMEIAGETSSSILVFEPTSSPAPVPASEVGTGAVPATTQAVFDGADGPFAPRRFDFGAATLDQDWVSDGKARSMPVRLVGLIAAPPAGEDLPVAVIIHGSHGVGCTSRDGLTVDWPCPATETRHYEGFAYLLQALAQRGYVAIAIDANPGFASAFGGSYPNQRLPLLLDLYTAKLAAADRGEDIGLDLNLAGRLDWQKLVALGHSAGGEALAEVMNIRATRSGADDIAAGRGPLAAAILLAPSRAGSELRTGGTPFAVILPACDRDVVDLGGQGYFEDAVANPQLGAPAVSIYLPGANHNRFNAGLSDEQLGSARGVCDSHLLPAAAQRDFLAAYAGAFFDAALRRAGADPAAAGMDPSQPAPLELFGLRVLTSLEVPVNRRLTLSPDSGQATGSTRAVLCPAGYSTPAEMAEECRRTQVNQPGNPEQIALSWSGAGSSYQFSLPEGKRDLSGYAALELRAAVDPLSPLNAAGQPQSFSVRVTDGRGKMALTELVGEPALAYPEGKPTEDAASGADGWDNHLMLSAIRVPLSQFRGVDLGDTRSIAIVFDSSASGAIFVSALEAQR
jgi:dienelactone hydrolase